MGHICVRGFDVFGTIFVGAVVSVNYDAFKVADVLPIIWGS